MEEKLDKKLARIGKFDVQIDCMWKGKAAIVAMSSDQLAVVGSGVGQSVSAPYIAARVVEKHGLERDLRLYAMRATVTFEDEIRAGLFDDTFEARSERAEASVPHSPPSIPPVMLELVTTLDRIRSLTRFPGHGRCGDHAASFAAV